MRQPALVLTSLLALGTALPAAAAAGSPTLRIQVTEDDGEGGVDVTIGARFLAGLVGAFAPAHLDCDGDHDPKLAALMERLTRDGEGSWAVLREDGDELRARRRDGLLDLDVFDSDGHDAHLVLPWPLAQCLFSGGEVASRDIARALARGELRLEAHGDGDNVRITIE
jgi:hypothetical protein